MSVSIDRKQIVCDGENCEAVTFLPIALRPSLQPKHLRAPAAEGWLFILGNGGDRHFCPRCAARHLDPDTAAFQARQN